MPFNGLNCPASALVVTPSVRSWRSCSWYGSRTCRCAVLWARHFVQHLLRLIRLLPAARSGRVREPPPSIVSPFTTIVFCVTDVMSPVISTSSERLSSSRSRSSCCLSSSSSPSSSASLSSVGVAAGPAVSRGSGVGSARGAALEASAYRPACRGRASDR